MASQGPKETKEIIKSGLTCDTDAFEDLPVDFFSKRYFSGLLGLQFGPKRAEIQQISYKMAAQGPREPKEIVRSGLTCDTYAG